MSFSTSSSRPAQVSVARSWAVLVCLSILQFLIAVDVTGAPRPDPTRPHPTAIEALIGAKLREVILNGTVSGLVAGLQGESARQAVGVRFSPLRTETLARGAILPHVQELSLVPLLHDSVLV